MSREKSKRILQNFLSDMENAKKSHHTIVNYRSDLEQFLQHCSIDNLTVETLRTHLSGLNSKSPTTKARHISSLKTFLNWCFKKDYIQNNPIYKLDAEKPKCPTPLRQIERHSAEKIICSINIFNKNNSINLSNLKYRLLFTLMLEGGLKSSEALALKVEDIEVDTETILVNSEIKRRIPLFSKESIKLVRLYTNEADIKSGLIFEGGDVKSKPLSYQAVNRFWRKCCQKTEEGITLQQLRDCYAKDLIKRGFDIGTVSKLLGHRNIQNTAKYLA